MWTFTPLTKETVWGGARIAAFKGDTDAVSDHIGESWEVSDVEGSESTVAEGLDRGLTLHSLMTKYGDRLMGRAPLSADGRFPLLVKLIDASADLSIQVHPDAEAARELGGHEKNEMWYVADAAPGATLVNGFASPVDRDEFAAANGTPAILPLLRHNAVRPGDVFYIPAGRIHAIGAGAFIIEIQQTSATTYRVYDYDRPDKYGDLRELHTAEALRSIHTDDASGTPEAYTVVPDRRTALKVSPYFVTNLWRLGSTARPDYSGVDSFKVLIAARGDVRVSCGDRSVILPQGHTVLLAAEERDVRLTPLTPRADVIETYCPA